jgi:hypothetical protein
MKISRKQLKRFVQKERARLLRESPPHLSTPTGPLDRPIDNAVDQISNSWADQMETMILEDPEMFAGRSTEAQWMEQVSSAADELYEELHAVIREVLDKVETNLHDGQYF